MTEQKSSEPHHFTLNHRHVRTVVITIILTVIGYFCFTLWGGWRDVVQAMFNVGFFGIAVALSLSLVNYGLRFLRWHSYLNLLGHNLPWWRSFCIYIAGFALTTTPGKAGEALRSIFLKEDGMTYRKSLGAFFAERFSDLIAVVILSAMGLVLYRQGMFIVAIVAIVILAALIVIQNESWLRSLEQLAKRKLPERFAHSIEFALEMVLAFRSCYSWKSLTYGIILGVAAWGAEGYAFYYILSILGVDIGVIPSIFIYCFSLLIGSISFMPGGLGGAEIAMWQLLLFYGVPSSTTIAVTIVIRLTTLWFSVVLGLLFLPFCTRGVKDKETDQSPLSH